VTVSENGKKHKRLHTVKYYPKRFNKRKTKNQYYMPLEAEGTFRKDGRSDTGRIYVPAALVRDSQFPLKEGKIKIKICIDNLSGKPCLCITATYPQEEGKSRKRFSTT